MIIDVHGHYTTAPEALSAWRVAQIGELGRPTKRPLRIDDDEIRASVERAQLDQQRARGIDLTLFSPRASAMGHHVGGPTESRHWAETCNDLVHRVCALFPRSFVGVCQLPQSPGVPPSASVEELERCVRELGFVGCNLNPDPSGGYWSDPPLTDRWWYPLYEKLVELDVPAMIHASASCNPNFHSTGAHYINGDTTVFMQLIQEPQLFRDFPTLRLVIPHGGGAAPYHWGRYRGLSLDMGHGELKETVLRNVWFDTCVYGGAGMELLIRTVSVDSLLFASEMIGAIRERDPETGRHFDDTKFLIDRIAWLTETERQRLYEANALRVYPRLRGAAAARAALAS